MRASDLTTHVDIRLVGLSLAAAIIASYAALDLAQRSGEAKGSHRGLWIGGAGVTMGLGIWSMHFIGMLALQMQMPVSYNNMLVLLSLAAAVLGACVSLATVARPQVSRWGVLSAAAFMGFAVAAMHYLGMASMQMAAVIHWNIALVIASVAIGFVASLFALWLIVRIRLSSDGFGFSRRLLAAVLLGLGVAGLHYVAMAASTFRPTAAVAHHNGLGTSSLVMMLALGAGFMLAALIGGAGLDQRRAALAKDIALIAELARQLSRIGDARDRVCQAIQELTGADFALLIEPANDGGREISATSGLESSLSYSEISGEDPHVEAYVGSSESTFVSDLEAQDMAPSSLQTLTGAVSVLFEPFSLDGYAVGVLAVAWRRRTRQPPDRTRTLLTMLAAEAAVAIDREVLLGRLEHLSRRDDLTGLLNRRVLTEELDRQLDAATRHDRPLSVVILDLDHFKDYNDTHGHQAGDLLLKAAAAAWTATLRQSDTLVRYGGEEFVVVMPDCPLQDAGIAADRLRGASPNGTTCSAGAATLQSSESSDQLLSRADRALYKAKNTGRNRTCTDSYSTHAILP